MRQIVRDMTVVERDGKTNTNVHYAITNLHREKASTEALMRARRGRWGIENRTFYVRDTASARTVRVSAWASNHQ